MPKLLLRQPWFTYSTCGPFTKHGERVKKFRETGDLNHIYILGQEKPRFKDIIWAGDLVDMGSLSSCGVKYVLCAIDVFTKYGQV